MPIGNGSVSAQGINLELGRSSTATISIDTAENGGYATINTCSASYPSSSNPASFSEWRNYNHGTACCNAPSISAGNVGSTSLGFAISYSNCSTMHFEYSSNNGYSWTTASGGCASYYTFSSLQSNMTYLIRVRITCASNNAYSAYSNTISMTTSGGCPVYGYYLSSYCSGCTLYYRYADGACGYYDVSQGCSTTCGGCCCAPASGTYLSSGCNGCDYGNFYADGCYGQYFVATTPNHPECGCGGGVDCYWGISDGAGQCTFETCDGQLIDLQNMWTPEEPIDYCINFAAPYFGVHHYNQSCIPKSIKQ